MYMVNFENKWAENKTINKLLDKVVIVALRLNLAPKRESMRQQKILGTQSKKTEEKCSKNYGHYIIRAEKKKLTRYQRK